MLVCIMALLAELGLFLFQQFCCLGSVWGVTLHAILFNRRMFPNVGTAFVGMALVAELVDVFGLDHVVTKGTMGVVAV